MACFREWASGYQSVAGVSGVATGIGSAGQKPEKSFPSSRFAAKMPRFRRPPDSLATDYQPRGIHMVTIRLARDGAKKRPFYEVVVTDRRRANSSNCIERIGFYNPRAHAQEETLRPDKERHNHRVRKG